MDILEAVSTLQVFLGVTSLSQFHISRRTWTIQPSGLLNAYTIVVILISLTVLLYGLFGNKDLIRTTDNDIGYTVDTIQMVGIRLAHLVSVMESLGRRKCEKQFIDQVREIDKIFESSLNVDVQNRALRRFLLIRGALMFSIYLLAQIIILISKVATANTYFSLYWLLYLLPFLVCGFRYFQYVATIFVIKQRFDKLIDVLQKIDCLHQEPHQKKDTRDIGAVASLVPMFATHRFLDQKSPLKSHNFKRLLIVRSLYNKLWELNCVVNRGFGISMLINLGNDFISITSNFYWIFLSFNGFTATTSNILQIIGSVIWSIPHLCNIFVLALLCERTTQRTTEVALQVHRLQIDMWNENHNAVIEQFSLQLLHQKVRFSAAGFFDVNCSLLYTIAGATTTYLIILIQFHMSEERLSNTGN